MKIIKKISALFVFLTLLALVSQPVMAGTSKININTASHKELTALKYVGEKTASKMIKHRASKPFTKPEDIMKVKGIGKKIYEANKSIIIVKDPKK